MMIMFACDCLDVSIQGSNIGDFVQYVMLANSPPKQAPPTPSWAFGYVSLDLGGGAFAHAGHSGILSTDSFGFNSGRFNQQEWDRLVSYSQGGYLTIDKLSQWVGENLIRDPKVHMMDIGIVMNQAADIEKVVQDYIMQDFKQKTKKLSTEDIKRLRDAILKGVSSNYFVIAAEFAGIVAILEHSPRARQASTLLPFAISMADITDIWVHRRLPPGFTTWKKSAMDVFTHLIPILMHTAKMKIKQEAKSVIETYTQETIHALKQASAALVTGWDEFKSWFTSSAPAAVVKLDLSALDRALAKPVGSVEDVISVMRALQTILPSGDGLRVFNSLYLSMTVAVNEAIKFAKFEDPQFITQLDQFFAGQYIAALKADRAKSGSAVIPWATFLDKRFHSVDSLVFLAAALTAHIEYDLVRSLVEMSRRFPKTKSGTVWKMEKDTSRHRDFLIINNILNDVFHQVKDDFLRAGGLSKFENSKKFEAAIMASFQFAREVAWTMAQGWFALNHHSTLEAIYDVSLQTAVGITIDSIFLIDVLL